ncbi:hypothetical protein A2U01_0071758 [Trifolium medium]|uniref:Uncharacterized protein n=1 Tax=Trifolium medium TaxID=97028 RepID=A0A392SQM0_9FABA|nr:hypothetical protein [Trifolium medium]
MQRRETRSETLEAQQREQRQTKTTTTAAPTVVERPKTDTATPKWERRWCGREGLMHHQ